VTIRRRLLTLSASAALHVAAVGLALVVAGVGAGSAVLMDLVADVEDDTASEARAQSLIGFASARGGRADQVPARRLAATPSPRVLSAGSPMPAPAPSDPALVEPAPAPRPDATAETRPKPEPQPETEVAGAPMARPDPASAPALASQGAKPRDDAAAVTTGAPSGVDAGTSSVASLRTGSAVEANTASAALGTPGEARGGIPAEYGLYYEAFRRRVQESLRYPLAARRQGLSGRVELEVLVEPSGRIGAVRVISSSSHPVLDDAALQAVRRLPPEPLPDRLPRRPLRIILPLGFELE